jgi:hypothetical protein
MRRLWALTFSSKVDFSPISRCNARASFLVSYKASCIMGVSMSQSTQKSATAV